MGNRPDPKGLGIADLVRRALELAASPDLLIPPDTDEPGLDRRPFVLVIDDDDVNGWVIAWPPGTDTGFHDHDGSRAVVVGLRGEVGEQRPVFGSAEPLSNVCLPGDVIELPEIVVHRMHALAGSGSGLTLHLYSPPLVRQGVYRLVDGRTVVRSVIEADEELRPLAP